MNNQLITRTNQKLSSAKQHFACFAQLDSAASKLLVNAYCESVVFQLYLTCNSFAQEMAEDYQVGAAKDISFVALAGVLENQSTHNAQCDQLALLQVNKGSWLCWLLDRYEKCWQLSNQSSIENHYEAVSLELESLIGIKNISERTDNEWLEQCIDELGRIISEYRELMQQW